MSTARPLPAFAWPTIEQASDRLFTAFDTDDDGKITVAEVTGVVDPAGVHGNGLATIVARVIGLVDDDGDGAMSTAEVDATLAAFDRNGDGSLTPADLGEAMAHDGRLPMLALLLQPGPPPGVPEPLPPVMPDPPEAPRAPTVDDVVDALFRRFDGDHDSAITLAELLAVLDPRGVRPRIDDAMASLVGAVDSNHDQSISEAEMAAAVATLDADDDGTLNHDDHLPGPPQAADDVDLIGLLLPQLRQYDAAALLVDFS
ncbi:EF-hand domain-containing protein [Aquabacterium humicola]|uniref:EF-hand domain-containing protein n=1 Tax=Aquabacterium humicola TaxID=3237377 RepID=UPI0025433CFD|nr:EF-hand domain-containing protein [Rubrivivax pictus]